MSVKAFKMQLKKGYEAEYKKRHDEIWPELAQLLTENGISEYRIFLDPETLILFAVQKKADTHPGSPEQNLAGHPVMRKWWDYMADIMEVNPDNSPVEKELVPVFRLD